MKTETTTQRKRRLEKKKIKKQEKLVNEDNDTKRQRLNKRRDQENKKTPTQRKLNLDDAKQRMQRLRAAESQDEHDLRIEKNRQFKSKIREIESFEQREVRLSYLRIHNSQMRAEETPEQRDVRLSTLRDHRSQVRTAEKSLIETFTKTINTFCDKICEVCTKKCYPNQVTNHKINNLSTILYLPVELASKGTILLCHRCKKHLTSKKTSGPAKAYWNNLDPGQVPGIIKELTQPEQRLLSRIIPFVKIVKYDGRFGQYGFKGQAVLFAQDIFEFTESLTNILPRSTNSIGMIVVTEHLENLYISREYKISRPRLYEALRWLINNNPLYHDVIINNDAHILQEDLIRVTQAINDENVQNNNQTLLEPATESVVGQATHTNDAYSIISNSLRILQASWHQGNNQVFNTNHAGSQCCAMVLANITRAAMLPPHTWTNNILNINMLEGVREKENKKARKTCQRRQ